MTPQRNPGQADDLGRRLGLTFADPGLLRQALIHTSYANERDDSRPLHNQRLEFLGDAVLELVVSDYLYRNAPELTEGELTRARAAVVCEPTLARRARELDIGRHLLLGRSQKTSGGRERESILADALEAIIGAVYLDGGYAAASACVQNLLVADLDAAAGGEYGRDYKTVLQEIVQQGGDSRISYEITGECGPDHSKTFTVAVSVNDVRLGAGSGRTKKAAEQNAARRALEKLNSGGTAT
jgi:ribonuclease-3